MTKQAGTIITIVVAVLTLCCSMSCCASGIYTVVDLSLIHISEPTRPY